VLIEDGHILLVEQRVNDARGWSLPGGTLEWGESVEACVIREMREETGLDVELARLLYLCDRIEDAGHVLHVTLAVRRVGGSLRTGVEPEPGANPIQSVRIVPLAALIDHGFSSRFRDLAVAGFPDAGAYRGPVSNIGL
jgi:ADP-ribose pyrophosphatase YjhB (NUDIX family)